MKKNTLFYTIAAILLVSFTITRFWIQYNNSELRKVVPHYKKEHNKEKLAAARFLIDNMEGSYSYEGEAYELIRDAYNRLGEVSESERNETIKKGLDTLRFAPKLSFAWDKDTITADFLISHIDFAYKTWKKAPWNNEVNFNNFCEYILPYKYSNEGISDYIKQCNTIFAPMLESINFEGGNRYEAIEQNLDSTSRIKNYDNSISRIIRVLPDSTNLIFNNIISFLNEPKTLFVQYRNRKLKSTIKIIVNNKDTIETSLKPRNHWHDIPGHRIKLPIYLNAGSNTIEIAAVEDTIGIEYIEVAPYERVNRDKLNDDIVDGANYIIRNVLNNKCLEITGGSKSDKAFLSCNDYYGEKFQQFNIQNIELGFYKISPSHFTDYFKCLDVEANSKDNNATILVWDFNKQSNQKWAVIPIGSGSYKIMNKLSGKCFDILEDNNQVVQREYLGVDSQHWTFERVGDSVSFDEKFHVPQNSLLEAARRIAEELDFEWKYLESNFPLIPANDVLNTRIGNCVVESQYQLYILRSLGIPVVIDFYPSGSNSRDGHEFNGIIDNNNRTINCQVGHAPGTWKIEMPIAKVFRKNYSINKSSLAVLKGKEESIPEIFNDIHLTDVTAQHCNTLDANVNVFEANQEKYKHAYLCTYGKSKWNPIWWSQTHDNKCIFSNMGLGVLYAPAYYTNQGEVIGCGYPFILGSDSTVCQVKANSDSLQTLVLKRKYPWKGEYLNGRMNNGIFEGANKADFSDAKILFIFKGDTEPVFYNLPVKENQVFKYARFRGANGTNSTLNELIFLDQNGDEITGSPIGSTGSYNNAGNTIEKAFDKDILTYYDGAKADGMWLGLKFDQPSHIGTIRFIPRNDGNCVEIGDIYELEYWNNMEWISLGSQTAKTDSLIYENCPTNAVFILHDNTKGKEERIFTVDKSGNQVWW